MNKNEKIVEVIRKIYRSSDELRHTSFEIQRLMLPYFKHESQQEEDELTQLALLSVYIQEVGSHINDLRILIKEMEAALKP